ncbi:hypothetical protein Hypma_001326 [Hypsizygus marmoreus]|uniref:RNase III domain-containing protein n=1 Tax=Hypsizygus marmoreus TaxID=39966 RepID=A0A369K4A0_HYPMA|nr:hypothetical protein Hypma_001326 [Hypsizygus marmoreus]
MPAHVVERDTPEELVDDPSTPEEELDEVLLQSLCETIIARGSPCLPPVRSFYKLLLAVKAVDRLEWLGDSHLYSLMNHVLESRRIPRGSVPSPGLARELLTCNKTLETLMIGAFGLDLPHKKAADLFEVFVGIAIDDCAPEDLMRWAIATFGPLLDSLYEECADDYDDSPRDTKKRRRSTKENEPPRPKRPRLDPMVPSSRILSLRWLDPRTLRLTAPSGQPFHTHASAAHGPYNTAALFILQHLLAQPNPPALQSSEASSQSGLSPSTTSASLSSHSDTILVRSSVLSDSIASSLFSGSSRRYALGDIDVGRFS